MKYKFHWYRFTFRANNKDIGTFDRGFIKKDHITKFDLKRIEAEIADSNNFEHLFITSKMYLGHMTEKEFNGE